MAGEGELQIPRLPPDFLSGLVASVNLVRLSLKKAAYVAVDSRSLVGNPEFARDDKGEDSVHLSSCYTGWTYLYAEREANDPSIHITNCRGRNKSTPLSSRPGFPVRGCIHDCVCGFQ